jgi:AcrR family transcriptional regulator
MASKKANPGDMTAITSRKSDASHPVKTPPVKTPPQKAAAGKAPQRQRGKDRVAALLAAAVEVFAEKGYEAATMTEIAARAGASIGSLYQFFATKDVLAAALHEANGAALSEMLAALARQTSGERPALIADRLFAEMQQFLQTHPAFVVLLDRRDPDHAAKQARRRKLREQLAVLLQHTRPALPVARAQAMAVVILHLMKAAMTISGETDLGPGDREQGRLAIDELRQMLQAHLEAASEA